MSLLNIRANSVAEVRKFYRGRACAVADLYPSARAKNFAWNICREGGVTRPSSVPRLNRKENRQLGVTGVVTRLSNTDGINRVALRTIHS